MTLSETERCAWCGAGFRRSTGPGRPGRYCRRSHRQRAYESRALARSRNLGEDEVLMSARVLADLQDALYVLEAALEDVDTDLADDPEGHRKALWHLYGAAAGLRALRPEPKATGSSLRP